MRRVGRPQETKALLQKGSYTNPVVLRPSTKAAVRKAPGPYIKEIC